MFRIGKPIETESRLVVVRGDEIILKLVRLAQCEYIVNIL